MSLKKKGLFLGGLLVALVAFVAAGCGGGGGGRRAGGPAVVVVYGDRVRGRRGSRLPARLRPAAAGRVAHTDGADRERDPLRAEAGRLQGRRLQDRLPVVRRRHRSGRQVGLGQVQRERQRVRGERQGDRHHRHLQLRLRRHHHPGRQPGAGRRHRDALAGEHVRLPDPGRARAATRRSRTSTTRRARATTRASSRTTATRVRRTPSSRRRSASRTCSS